MTLIGPGALPARWRLTTLLKGGGGASASFKLLIEVWEPLSLEPEAELARDVEEAVN